MPGSGGGVSAPGTMQHVAFDVETYDELLAMRDRIRSRGVNVMGPIHHGMCDSIYFAGPEGLTLEVATSKDPIDPDHWIDPEVVALAGISRRRARPLSPPAAVRASGAAGAQPADRSRPAAHGVSARGLRAVDVDARRRVLRPHELHRTTRFREGSCGSPSGRDEAEGVAVDVDERGGATGSRPDARPRWAPTRERSDRGGVSAGTPGRPGRAWKWIRSGPVRGISGGPLHVIFGPVPSGAWIAVSSS